MILVTGANGNLGKTTIDFILDKNPEAKIAGLVRDKSKGKELENKGVELRIGDYFDHSSLLAAFNGIDTLLFVSSNNLQERVKQHKNVIDAAKEAGVKQIVYTSLIQAHKLLSQLAPDHYETEKILKESGTPYTIFRNTFYAEFIPMFIGKAHETGEWYFPGDKSKVNFALRTEMGEALANVLLSPEVHKNKVYEITAGPAYTLSEIAGFIGDITGKKVNYTHVPIDVFRKQLSDAGLPTEMVEVTIVIGESFVNGALDYEDGSFEKLLGRKPAGIKEFLNQYLSSRK